MKFKIDFQDGGHGFNLGFLIKTILAMFYLQVPQILPTKFQVNWPFYSGKKFKIDSQDGGHFGFPIAMILAIFDRQDPPTILPTKF